jgi:hypothetical protein
MKSFPSYATLIDATTEDMMTGQNGTKTIAEDVSVDPQEAPPIDNEILIEKNKKKRGIVLVESDVRRSPRIKIKKNGFKDLIYKDKNCLGYNAKPLALSTKAIRKISSTLL